MDFHFLRPGWLLAILPLIALGWYLWRQNSEMGAWGEVCDKHLLAHLIQFQGKGKRRGGLMLLLFSALSMILALAGPAWLKLPVPIYQQIQPRVVILNMSDGMLASDLSPNRLSRAKFKLHDLFNHQRTGQFGLVVYTSEPFVVSPLTDDARTIDALLPSLNVDVMPVQGNRLDSALEEAEKLLLQAGFNHGQLLVLTSEIPDAAAIEVAKRLAHQDILTSVMPVTADKAYNALFEKLSTAGRGQLLPLTASSAALERWFNEAKNKGQYHRGDDQNIPLWRDEGRWLLLPALMLLLPVFRRGWLQRITAV